jgi:hypothetical protein
MINIHFYKTRLLLLMKQQIITMVTILLLLSFSGCKKFLDVPPKDRVPQSLLFNDEQGFHDAMIGVYLALDKPRNVGRFGLYTQNLSMGMLSTLAYNYDNATVANAGTEGGFFNNTVIYAYADAGTVKPEIEAIWGGMYSTIASLNNLLNQVDGKKSVFTKDNYYRVKGEAVAARAMLHFDLLRLFGESPLTGATAKAIPYVRKYDIRSTPFSTLNEALDSCIYDLHEAKNLLALTDTGVLLQASNDLFAAYTQNHINYWTVKALLARAHLYKGNTDSAKFYATAVIGSNKFPLINSNVALATLPVRDRLFSQELLFAVYSTNVKGYNGLFDKTSGTPLRLINKNAIYTTGSGSASDYRLVSWFDNNQGGVNVPSKYFQDNNLPYPLQNIVPVVRVSEMYYIAAECANAKSNIGEAVTYLNMVRQSRGLTSLNAAGINNADSVSTEIMREYQKEFMQEGQTFFYYKRLNKDLTKVSLNTAIVPQKVYVFPLPEKELLYNF